METRMKTIVTRSATRQGSKHIQLGYNNQDAWMNETFGIPAWRKQYHVGIVSDGCSGLPRFSRTEVGANLISLFAYTRIQEFLCGGVSPDEIPRALFQACAEFVRNLSNTLMPSSISWPYPAGIEDRATWSCTQRLRADYFSATFICFICDGEDVIIMSRGDGIILINDELKIIDQDDKPDYLASSTNNPGSGFVTQKVPLANLNRLVISTDGLKELMTDPAFVRRMFEHMPGNPMGLQFLLNRTYLTSPELMKDDCTAITLEVV